MQTVTVTVEKAGPIPRAFPDIPGEEAQARRVQDQIGHGRVGNLCSVQVSRKLRTPYRIHKNKKDTVVIEWRAGLDGRHGSPAQV